jgi:tRNA A37 N6-isopentenylltransferase MiaA
MMQMMALLAAATIHPCQRRRPMRIVEITVKRHEM